MDFHEMARHVQAYHNKIVERCIRVVLALQDENCDLSWEDFTDFDRGYYKAIEDARDKMDKLKIRDSKKKEVV